VDQGAFGANILSRAFGYNVGTTWFIPFSLYFKASEVTWTGTMFGFDKAGHFINPPWSLGSTSRVRATYFRRNYWPSFKCHLADFSWAEPEGYEAKRNDK
jgi:hypothetical protein